MFNAPGGGLSTIVSSEMDTLCATVKHFPGLVLLLHDNMEAIFRKVWRRDDAHSCAMMLKLPVYVG